MKYTTEAEIKKALDIDSFRNLSKDKVMRFAAMMPDMDREVALKIVEQFPAFKTFALEAVDLIHESQECAQANNAENQERLHEAWHHVRRILEGQLTDESLTWEQKKEILNLIIDTANQESAKDSENKQFLKSLVACAAGTICGVVALGVVFVGGKFALDQRG